MVWGGRGSRQRIMQMGDQLVQHSLCKPKYLSSNPSIHLELARNLSAGEMIVGRGRSQFSQAVSSRLSERTHLEKQGGK